LDHLSALCHQVIEKGLKGLHIEQKSELAPRSHDLAKLARAVGLSKEFEPIIDEIDSDYLASRYPDAAEGIPAENFGEAEADSVLKRTKEVFLWIQNQSTSLSHSLDD
jgi:HEPN domain-containing protein